MNHWIYEVNQDMFNRNWVYILHFLDAIKMIIKRHLNNTNINVRGEFFQAEPGMFSVSFADKINSEFQWLVSLLATLYPRKTPAVKKPNIVIGYITVL